MIELERWFNALERWLLLQRAMYGSGLGLTNNHMMLTTTCNSTFMGSDALFWLAQALHTFGTQACWQAKQPHR